MITPVAEAVGDGITPVAAEILPGDLHARRRLAALVFSDVEQVFDPVNGCLLMSAGDDLLRAHLLLDQAFENVVEHGIGRQRILIRLVGAEFGRRRLVDDVLRNDFA